MHYHHRVMDPQELQRLRAMAPSVPPPNPTAFAGGASSSSPTPQGAAKAERPSQPSRALLQQLHDAGMADALPRDVQALLRTRPGEWRAHNA